MFAIIDSGTTNSRVYLVNDSGEICASGNKRIGVRDTSITGSPEALRNGLTELFYEVLRDARVPGTEVSFAIASGMITSEIGLIELPHLVAPVGLPELSAGTVKCEDPDVLPIGRPVYFIRGVRNCYRQPAQVADLGDIDFMRGEEVQCIGILDTLRPELPCNIIVLSSHTKLIYIDDQSRICSSITTLSGQLYDAIRQSTNIGKSLVPVQGEKSCGYTRDEILAVAKSRVEREGLVRALLMPRFMQVLMDSTGDERSLFLDAVIAADDMRALRAMDAKGLLSRRVILFGHAQRCEIYESLLRENFGSHIQVQAIHEKERIDALTVKGVMAVARSLIQNL